MRYNETTFQCTNPSDAMSVMTRSNPRSVSDLLRRLAVPAERILLDPRPGFATEADAIRARHCELIDGTLVEKAMGYYESRLAVAVIYFLERYLDNNPLGFLLDGSGMIRVTKEQIRLPDVSFFSWDHFPDRKLPAGQVLGMVPDLPVEILSPTNTPAEMTRKRREFCAGGAKLVWEVNPATRSVEVFTAPDVSTTLKGDETLDGGDVLPGFRLSIHDWFARAGDRAD
ncbi:MAG: Uma2 family endonuclease [Planctomycetes bacterium]|nr:Uma2 family endonuclease [Planctomycetota bacterium]